MASSEKPLSPILSILGTVLLTFQLAEAFTGNRTLFTGLLILVSLIAIGAGMWKYAFEPSVIKGFPKYQYHWLAKIIIFLDIVSILITAIYIFTILDVIPDCCNFVVSDIPTPTPTATQSMTVDKCEGITSKLYINATAYSANKLETSLNIRNAPGLKALKVNSVKNGTEFLIIGGPVCVDNIMWWEATTSNGNIKGWIAEASSNGTYYLLPK